MDDARGGARLSPPPPPRTAAACGALGRYRPQTVAAIAAAFELPISEVHRDRRSMLMLDRPPVGWRHGLERGFAWSEEPDPGGLERPRSWEDAATRLRACGLGVAPGGRRQLHSSVTGVGSVYYLNAGEAVYFASRIDPLVRGVGGPLTVDWRAWASILCVGHPIGERTPFDEVRVLGPYRRLSWARGRVELSSAADWPWSRVEPGLGVAEGAEPMLDSLRAAASRLARHPATSLLSGGLDSRLLLALLVEAGADVRGLTLGPEEAAPTDRAFAAELSRRYGLDHDVYDFSDADHYVEVWKRHSLRVDYQRVRPPWLSALSVPLGERRRVACDGLGLDALATHATRERPRFYDQSLLGERDPSRRTARALWKAMARRGMRGAPARVLSEPLAERLREISLADLIADSRTLRGNPSQALLLFYRNRTVRGVSNLPHHALGLDSAVATPFVNHDVALACLGIDPVAKLDFRLYDALFAAVDPALRKLDSNAGLGLELPAESRLAPRRLRRSPAAIARFEALLEASPLAARHSAALRERLGEGALGAAFAEDAGLYKGVLALSLLGEWVERYGSLLRDPDPAGPLEAEAETAGTGP